MIIKVRLIFPLAASVLLAFPAAHAATANAATNMLASDTNASSNLNATMTRLFGDPVIAKGKGFEIKQSDLDDVMSGLRAAAAQHNQTIPPAQLKPIQGRMLNQLIRIQVLLQTATAADRAKGKETAEEQMKALLERAGSKEALDHQFMALGMSMAQLRKRLEQEGTAQAALVRALKIHVTDAEAKKFYAEHPGKFEIPQRVRIEQIFLSTRDPATGAVLSNADKAAKAKEMENVLQQAKSGADFRKLVEKYSDDPTAKKNGGEATIVRGQLYREPQLEAELFSLNTNQISGIITNANGYYLVKVLEKLPAKKLDYDSTLPNQTVPDKLKVSDYIKMVLRNEKVAELAPDYLAKLRKEDGVKILDPDLKAAVAQAEKAAKATNAPPAVMGK